MKVAMLGWEFPPFVSGGLGVHCYELTKRLAELGVLIDFYMPRARERPVSPHKNIRIVEVDASYLSPYTGLKSEMRETYGWSFLEAVESYRRQVVAAVLANVRGGARYDLMHNHDWLTVDAAGELKQKLSIPLVFTVHSTEYDRASVPWDRLLAVEKRGLAQADRIITVSNRMRERLMSMGADDAKIRVIYNAVNVDDFEKYNGGVEGKREKIVLFLGRLVEQKAPMQFLHAAKKVSGKMKGVRFVIAGTGDLLPQLISASIHMGLQDVVTFTGYLSDEEQRRAYASSDVYVMPSVSEPFGITALEAMASGTPVIISKSSGVGEIVKNALRVDFWDVDELSNKIIGLLRYPVLRRELGKEELKEVRKFTWRGTAARTLDVYKEVAR
ncbi:Trehalose synthase [Candidatus Burarchaeum australiense]|nr:Trehalose synthase [Candidatus Burarchaeum australiense]